MACGLPQAPPSTSSIRQKKTPVRGGAADTLFARADGRAAGARDYLNGAKACDRSRPTTRLSPSWNER
jgi:hypothetical protein